MSCDEQKQGESATTQILETDFDERVILMKETPILEPSSSSRSEEDESCSSDVDIYHMNIAVDIIETCVETEDLELENEFLVALNETEATKRIPVFKTRQDM